MMSSAGSNKSPLELWRWAAEWLLLASALIGLALMLPRTALSPGESHFLLAIGAVGVWRYLLRAVHFTRAMLFLHLKFPALRKRADAIGAEGEPPHVYFLATSFRIDAMTTAQVYRSVIEEAAPSPDSTRTISCFLPTDFTM